MPNSKSFYAVVFTALIFICNFLFMDHSAVKWNSTISKHVLQDNSPPEVEIVLPGKNHVLNWASAVRYEITVSDQEDGESVYEEINPNEVLLEIEYLPRTNGEQVEQMITIQDRNEPVGLSIIKKSTCFGCHADKTSLVGPSFSSIAERYDSNPDTLRLLGSRIIEGTSGNWGSLAMPPNPGFSLEEAVEIADYILEQGEKEHSRIYPGLQGIFRVMDKPENAESGIYILTASYTDHGTEGNPGSSLTGTDSIILTVE